MKSKRTNVEAILTSPSRSKNKIINIMKPEVKNIDMNGMPRLEIFEKKPGISRSLLIARGYLEEESKPAFAVVINASAAATPKTTSPISPIKTFAPKDMGIKECVSVSCSNKPTVTKTTETYNVEIIPHARNIPSGMFLLGFLISSATLQTLVRPIKDMKTKPAVEKIGLTPCVVNGSNLEG